MRGLQEVVLSVFDIDRIAETLVAVGEYTRVALPDAPAEQLAAWHVPEDCTRIEQCLLTPMNDDRGILRVVVFHGVKKEVIRSSQRAWDTGGIFDVEIFSRDVRTVYRQLQESGWTAFSDPVDYDLGEFHVKHVIAIGPDGLVIALLQPYNQPGFELPDYEAMSRISNSTQFVADFDAAIHFYENILGWCAVMKTVITGASEPGTLIGLPMPQSKRVARKVALMHPTDSRDGSVEVIQCAGLDGRNFAERAVAPNVGLLALRFPVADAKAYARAIVKRGGALYTEPTRLDLAPYGPATIFSIRTPDGAILEFYQA